ncbi:hypothetical protein BA011_24775 (plasmid) [Rhizobium leguminosarum]|uniref:Uncharacterized protein n=1 Tax=Rhizobium leguminosarum TaxID=384 RepID=A0A1B1CGY5_RHILE|nr:hypothetical protein BA011_24775 [Rhizobium leguminosarum]
MIFQSGIGFMSGDCVQEPVEHRVEALRFFPEGRVTSTFHYMRFVFEEQLDVQARKIAEFDKGVMKSIYKSNGYISLFDGAPLIHPLPPQHCARKNAP